MRVKLTGYFKFKPVAEAAAKIPDSSVSEMLLRHSAGADEWFGKSSARDAWNAVVSRCTELGWYKNGGWRPHGSSSYKCWTKDMGDVLGVCVSFGCCRVDLCYARTWLYCDKEFEKALLEDFFPPDERLRLAVRYGICGAVVDMKRIPGETWFKEFCRKTHNVDSFASLKYHRTFTRQEALAEIKRLPKLAKYIRTMLLKKKGEED